MRKILVNSGALVIAVAAAGAPSVAHAQYVLTGDKNAPLNVVGFSFQSGQPALSSIAQLVDPLGGFPTQGRWTVGDLDRDGSFEVPFTFPILANTGRMPIFTFDVAAQTYVDRGVAEFVAASDGRIFAGDVDGDGRDEALLGTFGNAPPQPRPAAGGDNDVYVLDFDGLVPLAFNRFVLPGHFVTRHTQFAARDVTNDGLAELLVLSQDQAGASAFNEPLGAATLFICTPLLATPGACVQLGAGTIPPNPEGRFPTDVDAGDFNGDGRKEIIIAWGTACQPNDSATVVLIDPTSGTSLTSSLGQPFQHVAAGDLDGDGVAELAVTAGGPPGLPDAARIYRFNTNTNSFDVLTQSPVSVPHASCAPAPSGQTEEPPAYVAVSPVRVPPKDGCDGVDNDNDGEVDENCLMRFLFVPICYQGSDANFKAQTTLHAEFLKKSLGLDGCSESVFVDWVSQSDFEISPNCDPNYYLGNFVFDLNNGLAQLGKKSEDWTAVVAFTNTPTFPANDPNPVAGLTFGLDDGRTYVVHLPNPVASPSTGALYNIIPEHVLSHEFGHLLGFGEEYVQSGGLNPLEARLGCNPDDQSCCDDPPTCNYMKGNRSRFGTGRCIMSYANSDTVPGAPATPRSWCENCYKHIKQLPPIGLKLSAPLSCGTVYNGNGPLLSLTGKAGSTGILSSLNAVHVPKGRPPLGASVLGEYTFSVESAAGAAIYTSHFNPRPNATLIVPGQAPPGTRETPLGIRIPLPPGVSPTEHLPVTVSKAGVLVSKTTLNGSPPVANAGQDRMLECTFDSKATAVLDGTQSSDPDQDTLRFAWSPTSLFSDPAVSTPAGLFPLGPTVVSLTVSDGTFESASDSAVVTVQDSIPPQVLTFTYTGPTCIWPPNNKYAVLRLGRDFQGVLLDACDPNPTFTIKDATSSQGGGTSSVVVYPDHVCLRAQRSSSHGEGRVYTVRLVAADHSGNETLVDVQVLVPHDQSQGCVNQETEIVNPGDPACAGI
jgi:hypothetical protein